MNEQTNLDKLKLLRSPFPENQISVLPKPKDKNSLKGNCNECGGYHGLPAVHLKYVGHAALTDRLLDVDPLWTWEPLAMDNGLPAFDKNGGLWIKLTVCGHTRIGYGNAGDSNYKDIGSREKEIIGDALRNAAMRFGAALDLWHKGDLHAHNDEGEQPQGNPHAAKNMNPSVEEHPIEPPKPDVFRAGKWNKKSITQVLRDEGIDDVNNYRTFLLEKKKKENGLKPEYEHAVKLMEDAINDHNNQGDTVGFDEYERSYIAGRKL